MLTIFHFDKFFFLLPTLHVTAFNEWAPLMFSLFFLDIVIQKEKYII